MSRRGVPTTRAGRDVAPFQASCPGREGVKGRRPRPGGEGRERASSRRPDALLASPLPHHSPPPPHSPQEKTYVPKECLSAAGALILLLVVLFGVSAGTVCAVAGFAYPAYQSLAALERRPRPAGEVTQWLVYWVVYALFSILETFASTLLYWIPFYYAFKFAFLLWAFLPQTRGAKFLYDGFLKELLQGHGGGADAAAARARGAAGDAAEGVKRAAAKKGE